MNYSSLAFLSLSTVVSVFYLLGVIFFLTDHEPSDKCEMTYMFEYPQYVRVSQKIDRKYQKYGLYAYGEGRTTKKARNMHFDGIPILFIPGNAGSHQQVRSLSSVALRKALNSGSPYHFDYFTVDLNSEFSALYGPVLYEQLEYVLSSVHRILELYKNNPSPPKKVVLIGHSIGGIIAKKAMEVLLENNQNLVSTLIVLAAPMKRTPIYFDRRISNFYSSSHIQDNITTISISGGHSDFLVPSHLTGDEGNHTINVVSTNIPKAWVESNHVQILWCKQVVLAINRALFDSVDRQSGQISTDNRFVRRVFKHHLIHDSGMKHHLKPNFQERTNINYKGEWIESLYKQYTIEHKKGLKHPHWYMVGFTALPNYEIVTVLAINLEVSEWIFACNAAFPNGASRVCIEADHLTQYSEIVPSSRFKRRLVTINMHELRKNMTDYTHIVFRALPTSKPVTFHVDIYGSNERQSSVSLPRFSLTKQLILTQTPEKAIVYSLILPELQSLLQVYRLFVEPVHCSTEQHHATASLILPWTNENSHAHFTESMRNPFIIRLQNSKPQNGGDAVIRLTLEPTCTYKISVRLDIIGMFGQLARYYSPFLITSISVVFLLGFQKQIYHFGQTGSIPIFFSSLLDGLKQSWILLVAVLISKVSQHPILLEVLPTPEFINFPKETGGLFTALILFMVSIVILLVLVAAYCVSLFALESTVHKLTLKMLARSVTLSIRFSDYFMSFLHKVPFIVAAVLVSLCFGTCGGLALCLGTVFYFLKLTQLSQDYVEKFSWFLLKYIARKCKKMSKKYKKETTQNTNKQSSPTEESPIIESINTPTKSIDNKDENEKQAVSVASKNTETNKDPTIEDDLENANEGSSGQTTTGKDAKKKQGLEELKESVERSQNEQNLDVTKPNDSENEIRNENDFINNLSSTNNTLFFHSSMFFIWIIVTLLNVPAVLTWAHNFKYNKHLVNDESFLPGLVLSLCALPLWQLDYPRTNRKFTSHVRAIILCIIAVSLLYATVSVYRLNYMLTMLFALIMLQQCYAPKILENNETSDDSEEKQQESNYDEIKRKLD